MEILLFLAGFFLMTFILGRFLEEIRIPWIFASLLIGLGVSVINPFEQVTSSSSFNFLANVGLYSLLFVMGFEIDLKMIQNMGKFIVKTTFSIILAEAFFGSLLIKYLFGTSWLIAVIISLSFATVGEAMLIPILDEFKLTKKKLGQIILGIGFLDDFIEIFTIIVVCMIIGISTGHATSVIVGHIAVITTLFIMGFSLTILKNEAKHFKFGGYDSLFLFILFLFFLFVGIGDIIGAGSLAAILCGIALKNFIPESRLKTIESEIKTMSYGFFAPLFFFSVGIETDLIYLVKYPLMILAIIIMSNITKIFTSYIVGRNTLGAKKSILVGVALTVKFSTSIVIIKILFENNIIGPELYSVLIGTTIVFKFIVPTTLSYLMKIWKKDIMD